MKQVIQRLIDDLDQTGETEAAETVRFALDGVDYEIDLSEENATALREALASFVTAATKVGRSVTKSANGYKRTGTSAADRQRNAAIRQWATEQNMKVSPRGRIQNDVVRAYELRVERAGSAELVKSAAGVESDGAKPAKGPGAARRVAKKTEKSAEATPKPDPHQGTPAQRRELTKQMRAYWAKHRKNVPSRGSLPPGVRLAYEQQDPSLLPSSK